MPRPSNPAAPLTRINRITAARGQDSILFDSPVDFIEAPTVNGGPMAGGGISTPNVVHVTSDGDNDTGEVGNPALPYATAQAAIDAALLEGFAITLRLGVWNFGPIEIDEATMVTLHLLGEGYGRTAIGAITTSGPLTIRDLGHRSVGITSVTSTAPDEETDSASLTFFEVAVGDVATAAMAWATANGQLGASTGAITISGGSCGSITSTAANGADGANGPGENTDGQPGGHGGSCGEITIRNCQLTEYPTAFPGNGGDGGAGDGTGVAGDGGDGGNAPAITLQNCYLFDAVALPTVPTGGAGGTGDTPGVDGADGTILQLGVASDTDFFTS